MGNRLKKLNLKNFDEYYNFLRYDVGKAVELKKLFEVITTNETSFYRNPPQLQVFQDKVLTEVLKDRRAKGKASAFGLQGVQRAKNRTPFQ